MNITNNDFEIVRNFIKLKWKNILQSNIEKYKDIYPELNTLNIVELSKDVENVIYENCFYKKNNQIIFYIFCQMYIYIYLTEIFKDIYTEQFTIHIYNSYITNNIKNIVHCHEYILKNIINFDCSIQSEIVNYINTININVRKLTEYMFQEFKKWNKIKLSNSLNSIVPKYKIEDKNSKEDYKLNQVVFNNFINSIKNTFEEFKNDQKFQREKEIKEIKEIAEKSKQFSENILRDKYVKLKNIDNELKIKENELKNKEQLIKEKEYNLKNKNCECVDKQYLEKLENKLSNLIIKTQKECSDNVNKKLSEIISSLQFNKQFNELNNKWDQFSQNIYKLLETKQLKQTLSIEDINQINNKNLEYLKQEFNNYYKYFDENLKIFYNQNNNLGNKLNKNINDAVKTLEFNNKNLYDSLIKYQIELQKNQAHPVIKLPENIQNLTSDNFQKLQIEYNNAFSNKLSQIGNSITNITNMIQYQNKQFLEDHSKSNTYHDEIKLGVKNINEQIKSLSSSVQITQKALPQTVKLDDDVKKQLLDIIKNFLGIYNNLKQLQDSENKNLSILTNELDEIKKTKNEFKNMIVSEKPLALEYKPIPNLDNIVKSTNQITQVINTISNKQDEIKNQQKLFLDNFSKQQGPINKILKISELFENYYNQYKQLPPIPPITSTKSLPLSLPSPEIAPTPTITPEIYKSSKVNYDDKINKLISDINELERENELDNLEKKIIEINNDINLIKNDPEIENINEETKLKLSEIIVKFNIFKNELTSKLKKNINIQKKELDPKELLLTNKKIEFITDLNNQLDDNEKQIFLNKGIDLDSENILKSTRLKNGKIKDLNYFINEIYNEIKSDINQETKTKLFAIFKKYVNEEEVKQLEIKPVEETKPVE